MNKLLAIGLACCIPTGLAAEDPHENDALLGTMNVLVIEESMKMEMALAASIDGIVTAVRCREGEVVERSQVLIELEPIQGEGA